MSNLLLSESPLVLLPSLAVALGSAEKAIICQQLYYLMQRSEQVVDGKKWITLTVEKSNRCKSWAEILPWVRSERTLRSYLNELVELKIVEKRQMEASRLDKTLSWTLNTTRLTEIAVASSDDSVIPSGKNCRMEENAETAEESQSVDSVKTAASIRQKLPDINTESNKEDRINLNLDTRLNTISPNGDIADAADQPKNVSEILDGEVIPDTPLTQDPGAAENKKSFTAAAVDKRDPDVEKVLLVIREATGCEPEDPKGRAYVRFFAKSLANKLLRIAPSTPLGQSIFAVLSAARFLAEHGQTWDWDRAAQPRYLYRNCETIMRKFRSLPGRDTPVIPTL